MKEALRFVANILLVVWILLVSSGVNENRANLQELTEENEAHKVQIEQLEKKQEEILTLIKTQEEETSPEESIDKYENVAYDYNYVVSVVAGECGNEPYEGQMAVAQVILNRSKEWGMTPEEVVRQPGQFIAPPMSYGDIKSETWRACDAVFFNGEKVTDHNIKWFCTVGCNSSFHNSLNHVFTIGGHNFYE